MKTKETKQETIEEEAKNYAIRDRKHLSNREFDLCQRYFIAGAKHQAERMYSEEEVIAFTQWMYDYKGDINKVKDLLKQFKQK